MSPYRPLSPSINFSFFVMSSLQQVVIFLHRKKRSKSCHAQSGSHAPIPGAVDEEASQHPIPNLCWLCEAVQASPFTLSEALPLCLACFHLTYDALLRPQLFASAKSQRGELIARVLSQLQGSPEGGGRGGSGSEVITEPSQASFVMAASHSKKMFSEIKRNSASSRDPQRQQQPRSATSRTAKQEEASPLCWSCPRCTFFNPSSLRFCEACGCAQPQQLLCEWCQKSVLSTVGGSADICSGVGRRHQPWHCQSCTVINVVEGDACFLCSASRKWKCTRCLQDNVARSSTDNSGRHFCTFCGAMNSRNGDDGALARQYTAVNHEADREAEQQRKFAAAKSRLGSHLSWLGVELREQVGDGNCLFRSLAQQVFNCPHHHMLVRHMTTNYVEKHAEAYACLFDGPGELHEYLQTMRASGTWGDEVMLHAAAQWLGVDIHVITSDENRWHLTFSPMSQEQQQQGEHLAVERKVTTAGQHEGDAILIGQDGSDATVQCLTSSEASRATDSYAAHIFLAYLYPTHYDDVRVPVSCALDPSTALLRALRRVEAEELDWVRLEADLTDAPLEVDTTWVQV